MPSPLISPESLARAFGNPRLGIIDASWHLDGRDAAIDFAKERIPGAVYFDLDAHCDHSTDLPHMLPTPGQLATAFGNLGLARDDLIVVYDTVGIRSSARTWWMLKTLGAEQVFVLDGGLPSWKREDRPMETGPALSPAPRLFTPHPMPELVASKSDVLSALGGPIQILDARPAGRFQGREPEPRHGLRSGHMPGAISLPFPRLLAEDGTLKPDAELVGIFDAAGVDFSRPIITSCGSGVTAAIISLALAQLHVPSRLYDGSWAEWGAVDADTPVVTD